jgi:copper(I)-binding protein
VVLEGDYTNQGDCRDLEGDTRFPDKERRTVIGRNLIIVAALAMAASVFADSRVVEVTQAWSREMPPGAPVSVSYFTIINHGHRADRLIRVRTPVAGKAEMHTSVMEDGLMKMRPLNAVEVPPGEPTMFQPGGNHVMLMQVKEPLRKGESFPMILTFENAGDVQVHVTVEPIGAMRAGSHAEHQGDGHSMSGHSSPTTATQPP